MRRLRHISGGRVTKRGLRNIGGCCSSSSSSGSRNAAREVREGARALTGRRRVHGACAAANERDAERVLRQRCHNVQRYGIVRAGGRGRRRCHFSD